MTLCCTNKKTEDMLNRMLSVKQMLEIQNNLNNHLPMGKGWTGVVSIAHLETAIIDEASELLGSGVQWKWWGTPVDPDTYDEHNVRIEITDIIHFWLSIAILRIQQTMNGYEVCKPEAPFDQFDNYYVGTDMGNMLMGVGLISPPNNLLHANFMGLIKDIICLEWDFYGWVDVLDRAASSVGMSCEMLSAYYTAKAALNEARWDIRVKNGTYQKIVDGQEDNEKLLPLINDFLETPTMTLVQLRENVFNEFYEEV